MKGVFADSTIGFPPPLLGVRPLRLPVIHRSRESCIIWKPAGIQVLAHPWYEGLPCLAQALKQQLVAGKQELLELGFKETYPIYPLDAEIAGGTLWAFTKEAADCLKDTHGSCRFAFRFLFLARPSKPVDFEVTCELPLVPSDKGAFLCVSHRRGKKAKTLFKRVKIFGQYELWEAITHYQRLHQVRIHAAEIGLPILGENVYAQVPLPRLQDIRKVHPEKIPQKEPYQGLTLYLQGLSLLSNPAILFPKPPWYNLLRLIQGKERGSTVYTHSEI